ncbi:MAG: DeoR family transcriptional regulator [Patescibacteria group bacterium]
MSKNEDGYLEHIYERTQKITEALYRVTDLFSEKEPLKWLLRREGLEIFNSLLKIKSSAPNERLRMLELISDQIKHAVRVLDLASSGSFISEANFQVLKREYESLIDFMTARNSELLTETIAVLSIGQTPIGHISNGQKQQEQEKTTIQIQKEIKKHGILENKEKPSEKSDGLNERRDKIISIIKNRDWVSIGELTQEFGGQISEKTIQRDLAGMASEGLLLKEGDKRWRKYKFIS